MGYKFNPLPWRFDRVDGGAGGGDIETLTGNSGGAVGPDGASNVNILGSGNIDVAGNPGTNTLTISESDPSVRFLAGDAATSVPPDGSGIINIVGSGSVTVTEDVPGNTLTIAVSGIPNYICGTGSTIDTATVDLVTIAMGGSAACFTVRGIITGKAASAHAIGGQVVATVRTDGATATIVNTPDIIKNADLVLSSGSFTIVASGNDLILRAAGALGSVISWQGCLENISVTNGV